MNFFSEIGTIACCVNEAIYEIAQSTTSSCSCVKSNLLRAKKTTNDRDVRFGNPAFLYGDRHHLPLPAESIFTWEGMTSAKKLDLTAKQQLYDKTGYTETTRYDTDEQTDRSAHSAVHT